MVVAPVRAGSFRLITSNDNMENALGTFCIRFAKGIFTQIAFYARRGCYLSKTIPARLLHIGIEASSNLIGHLSEYLISINEAHSFNSNYVRDD